MIFESHFNAPGWLFAKFLDNFLDECSLIIRKFSEAAYNVDSIDHIKRIHALLCQLFFPFLRFYNYCWKIRLQKIKLNLCMAKWFMLCKRWSRWKFMDSDWFTDDWFNFNMQFTFSRPWFISVSITIVFIIIVIVIILFIFLKYSLADIHK